MPHRNPVESGRHPPAAEPYKVSDSIRVWRAEVDDTLSKAAGEVIVLQHEARKILVQTDVLTERTVELSAATEGLANGTADLKRQTEALAQQQGAMMAQGRQLTDCVLKLDDRLAEQSREADRRFSVLRALTLVIAGLSAAFGPAIVKWLLTGKPLLQGLLER